MTHQSNRVAVRVRDDGESRTPKRVVGRLLRLVSGARQVVVETIHGVARLDPEREDDTWPARPSLVPDLGELLTVEVEVHGTAFIAGVAAVMRSPLRRRGVDLQAQSLVELAHRIHVTDDDVDLVER